MARKSLVDATSAGSRLDKLRALEMFIAGELDHADERTPTAQLARQYRETVREIEEIEGGDGADDPVANIVAGHAGAGKPTAH